MPKSKVAVIGGQGFIGNCLINNYGMPGWTCIDIKSGRDFRDLNVMLDADVVVFLAAFMGHTLEDYEKNLELYVALAQRYARRGTHIIYASSAAVYNDTRGEKTEWSDIQPNTLYGKSKLLGETIIRDSIKNHTILRLANVYGTGDGRGVIDLFQNGHNIIYGDGSQVRDYVSVEDVCKAISIVADDPTKFRGKTINISSGLPQTVNQVFRKYGQGEPQYQTGREFDVPYSVLDNKLAVSLGLL